MREESHLDEMRSAIRGDFERLKERRGEQELMRVVEAPRDVSEEPLETPAANVDEPEPVDAGPEEAPLEPEPELPPEPELESEFEPALEPEPQRSWLARFFSP